MSDETGVARRSKTPDDFIYIPQPVNFPDTGDVTLISLWSRSDWAVSYGCELCRLEASLQWPSTHMPRAFSTNICKQRQCCHCGSFHNLIKLLRTDSCPRGRRFGEMGGALLKSALPSSRPLQALYIRSWTSIEL